MTDEPGHFDHRPTSLNIAGLSIYTRNKKDIICSIWSSFEKLVGTHTSDATTDDVSIDSNS